MIYVILAVSGGEKKIATFESLKQSVTYEKQLVTLCAQFETKFSEFLILFSRKVMYADENPYCTGLRKR